MCFLPCSKRLAKMISTMRERMSAKLGNNNDNAFKMRKLFKMYDKEDTGRVSRAEVAAGQHHRCTCAGNIALKQLWLCCAYCVDHQPRYSRTCLCALKAIS